MKFVTILLLIWYFIKLINQNFLMKDIKKINNTVIDKSKEEIAKLLQEYEFVETLLKSILALIINLSVSVIEIFYILSAVQYGDKNISLVYLAFWMAILLGGIVQYKLRGKEKRPSKNFSLLQWIINLVDFAYFGYMYYVLFLM